MVTLQKAVHKLPEDNEKELEFPKHEYNLYQWGGLDHVKAIKASVHLILLTDIPRHLLNVWKRV